MRPERALRTPSAPAHGGWVDTLSRVAIFTDLRERPGALAALAGLMKLQRFRPGEPILTEGESGSELYVLLSGEASVYKSTVDGDRYRVAIIKSEVHAVLGEGGLLGSDARSATILAETACECLVLGLADFEHFSLEHPDWAMPVAIRIARAVMERLHKANNDLMLLYNALVAEIRGK